MTPLEETQQALGELIAHVTGTSAVAQGPDALEISTHELVAAYHSLRLLVAGQHLPAPTVTQLLNQRTGRRWTARRWLRTLKPAYERMTGAGGPTTPSLPAQVLDLGLDLPGVEVPAALPGSPSAVAGCPSPLPGPDSTA